MKRKALGKALRRVAAAALVAVAVDPAGAQVATGTGSVRLGDTPAQDMPALDGELLVFDLRRLEVFRARADGTDARKLDVGLDSDAAAVAAGAAGAFGAAAGYGMASFSVFGGGASLGAAAPTMAAGAAVLALPAFGIIKLVQVGRRGSRPVRSVMQAQPMAALSPDGQRVLVCTKVGKDVRRGRMKLFELRGDDGSNAQPVATFPVGGPCPDISPDGARALFVAAPNAGAAGELYVIDLETRAASRVTHDEAPKAFARWSPDGARIVYQQVVVEGDGASVQVFVCDADGDRARQLTHDAAAAVTPSWSADGRQVLYASLADGSVRRIPVNGGESSEVVGAGPVKLHPQASPDGLAVMYLESATEPRGLGESDGGAPVGGSGRKDRLGTDFTLKVAAVGGSGGRPIELRRPKGRTFEKTNLFWYRWSPSAAG